MRRIAHPAAQNYNSRYYLFRIFRAVNPPINDINLLENILTDSIVEASESTIPKVLPSNKKAPWVNDDFMSLTKKRRTCKDPGELKRAW